jgi:metal-responsive CopG/Arc/MetJ family transcriptional regulator
MANQHRHRQRVIRGVPDDLAEQFDQAAKDAGSDRSAVLRAFMEWFVRRPDVELPERP